MDISAKDSDEVASDDQLSSSGERGKVIDLSGWFIRPEVAESTRHQREVAQVNKEQQSHPLDNTILKIDRLYDDREAELKMQERTPVDEYADTATGRSLADLINELDERHSGLSDTQQLDGEPAVAESPRLAPSPRAEVRVSAVEPDPEPVAMLEPTPLNLAASQALPDGEEVPDLLREFEARVLACIDRAIHEGDRRRTFDHAQKVERIREAAALQVRKKEAALRASYRSKYLEKENALRAHYKKLIALANTVSLQKAQLQSARKQFDEKLRAAGELYRQMEDMRGMLRDRLENSTGTSASERTPPAES